MQEVTGGDLLTEGDRIKAVRQAVGATQEKFCEKIGIGRSALSQIESGRTNASNQTRTNICKEYQVKEEWLLTGEGEMFIRQDKTALLSHFFGEVTADVDNSLRKRLITALAKLDEDNWVAIARIVEKMTKDPE